MGISIRTSNFDIFNKLNLLKIQDTVIIKNNPMNRRHLGKIINNINNSTEYVEAILGPETITLRRRQPFHFNIYHSRR